MQATIDATGGMGVVGDGFDGNSCGERKAGGVCLTLLCLLR